MDILTTLEKTFSDLVSKKITSEEAVQIMKTPDIFRCMNSYINRESISPEVPLEDSDVRIMQVMVDILQFVYNDSGVEPPISDQDYDKLYELMVYAGGGEVIGYEMPAGKETHHHKYPNLRGTLTKVYYLTPDAKRTNPSRKYLDEWIKSREQMIYDATGEHIDLNDEEVYVFPKWDGVSGIQECAPDGAMVLALTRGDTTRNIAYDITRHLQKTVPESGITTKKPHGVKYEIMMRESELEKYNKKYHTDYKSTRSIVSSIINSDDVDERDELLVPVPLRVYEEGSPLSAERIHPKALSEFPSLKCKLKDRDAIANFAENHRYVDGLRTDGAVIHLINPKLHEILGRTDNKNNFEVAYKFTEEVAMSHIEGMEFSVKNFGRITPVAIFEPVKMKGNKVKRVSLGSKARFDSLRLAKGDEVKVHYDIIPYITVDSSCERSGKKPFEFPDKCPICGEPLNIDEDDAIAKCDNVDCPSKVTGRVVNYLSKMKIKNISYATVKLLHERGYLDNIRDLYKLEKKVFELSQIPTLGAVSVSNIINAINEKDTAYDFELFGSLGIESVGRKMFKKLFEVYTVDELIEIAEKGKADKLCKVGGIQTKTAEKIVDGINANKKTIEYLMKKIDILDSSKMSGSKFSICFTKVRDPKLEELIETKGGETSESVTKDTSALIVPDLETKSGKVDKAKKYGIPIIPYADAELYIKSNY